MFAYDILQEMDRILDKDHRLVQALFFILVAVVYGFGTFIMLSRGYTSFQIGIITAIGDISGLFLNFFIADTLDNSEDTDIFKMLRMIVFGLFGATLLNIFLNKPSIILTVAYIGIYCLTGCLDSLFASLSSMLNHSGVSLDFGRARAYGSLSYALSSVLFGYISEIFNYPGINICIFISQLLVLLSVYLMASHFYAHSETVKYTETLESISLKEYFFRHRNFILVLVGYSGIMAINQIVTENFLPQIIYDIGGSNYDLGLLPGLKAIVEVPFIFYFARLEKWLGLKKIFIIAAVSFVLKMYLFYTAKTMLWLYVSQLFQATSFSLILPGMVTYIDRIMYKNELQRSHGLMQITRTFFCMLISPLGGFIIENYGCKQFCFVGFIICLISAVVFVIAHLADSRKTEKEEYE